jgi:lambda family phage portal protein
MGVVELPDGTRQFGTIETDGSEQEELEPGLIMKLKAGEKFTAFMPNRPNSQLDPFMRMMLREVAAGIGCSYESLSKDYSQSNYSASRLALIDDRDLWKTLQQWFVRDFRSVVHREWLQAAVLSGALPTISKQEYAANPEKFEAARYKCRGWGWINPKEEVAAAEQAVKAGFRSVTEVVEETGSGRDVEDVIMERKAELALFAQAGILTETDPKTVQLPDAPMTTQDVANANAPSPEPKAPITTDPEADPDLETSGKKAVECAEEIIRRSHAK